MLAIFIFCLESIRGIFFFPENSVFKPDGGKKISSKSEKIGKAISKQNLSLLMLYDIDSLSFHSTIAMYHY